MIIAGNWKMNTLPDEGTELVNSIIKDGSKYKNVTTIFAVPFTHLSSVAAILHSNSQFCFAAQDCSAHPQGAYTGEVSAKMVRSTGATHVIIGHSERRAYHHENNELLFQKLQRAAEAGLIPIFCCGETLEDRESGRYREVIQAQLKETVFREGFIKRHELILAYEPVWAIGTGKTASPEQASEVHTLIRGLVREHTSARIPVLYGGSCNPGNARQLFSAEGIDGGLIGGASLKAGDFLSIMGSASSLS